VEYKRYSLQISKVLKGNTKAHHDVNIGKSTRINSIQNNCPRHRQIHGLQP